MPVSRNNKAVFRAMAVLTPGNAKNINGALNTYPRAADTPVKAMKVPEYLSQRKKPYGLNIAAIPIEAINMKSNMVINDGLPGKEVITAPVGSLTKRVSTPVLTPIKDEVSRVSMNRSITRVVAGSTAWAMAVSPLAASAMKKIVTPEKKKQRAVENFIVTKAGEMLFRNIRSKIHAPISSSPTNEIVTEITLTFLIRFRTISNYPSYGSPRNILLVLINLIIP